MALSKKSFENNVGEGENGGCHQKLKLSLKPNMSSANEHNILSFGKELTHYHTIPTFDTPEKEAF